MIERLLLEIAKIRSEMIDGIQRLPERGRWCLFLWAEIDLRARPLTLGSFSSSGPLPCTRRRKTRGGIKSQLLPPNKTSSPPESASARSNESARRIGIASDDLETNKTHRCGNSASRRHGDRLTTGSEKGRRVCPRRWRTWTSRGS